ncbi:unnamed protein product [Heligmosomoides polygyrus]|uniref:RSN1_TM domain-containing protein n=1 Tax=Heligmosomoides polygyrus TaxID=6339 RepID=A0A183FDF2_HELPZ|nr:unnamed protein product [Heligmosomoides polygyrus]
MFTVTESFPDFVPAVFQASFAFFCRVAYPFWLSLVIYTSVVIISLYVYQFPNVSPLALPGSVRVLSFPDIWKSWTHLDKKWNDDIGLINYSNAGESGILFVRLFTPISLFVVAMLQLKFFHEPWMAMLRRSAQPPDPAAGPAREQGGTFSNRLTRVYTSAAAHSVADIDWIARRIDISDTRLKYKPCLRYG